MTVHTGSYDGSYGAVRGVDLNHSWIFFKVFKDLYSIFKPLDEVSRGIVQILFTILFTILFHYTFHCTFHSLQCVYSLNIDPNSGATVAVYTVHYSVQITAAGPMLLYSVKELMRSILLLYVQCDDVFLQCTSYFLQCVF